MAIMTGNTPAALGGGVNSGAAPSGAPRSIMPAMPKSKPLHGFKKGGQDSSYAHKAPADPYAFHDGGSVCYGR